jgi:hypothetical protein
MASTPTKTPNSLLAGANKSWSRSLDDFPASAGWALRYHLVMAGHQITIDSTPDDDIHKVTLVAADTASWNPGRYQYQAWVSLGADAHMVEAGAIEIKANFASQTTGYDGRTHAEKVLDALEAMIEGKASLDQQSYSVGGRSITRLTPAELVDWRKEYQREVNIQRRKMGPRKISRSIKVGF